MSVNMLCLLFVDCIDQAVLYDLALKKKSLSAGFLQFNWSFMCVFICQLLAEFIKSKNQLKQF